MINTSEIRQRTLEEATRGELLPQNEDDASVSVLIEGIEQEKNITMETVEEEDFPYSLPESWKWVRLGDYAEVIMGQSPPSSSYNDNKEGLPFYQGKTDFGRMYPTPRKWCTEPKKVATLNDVLLSVRAPVGQVNLCQEDSCIGRGLAAIRSIGESSHMYLYYYLSSIEEEIESKGTGTTFKSINANNVKNTLVPVPPLEEQHRIVKKIKKVMSLLEEIEENMIQL